VRVAQQLATLASLPSIAVTTLIAFNAIKASLMIGVGPLSVPTRPLRRGELIELPDESRAGQQVARDADPQVLTIAHYVVRRPDSG
jgi:hypothetical protein